MESSPAESRPDDVAQRAAAHAVRLSVKALRMTLQKIGGADKAAREKQSRTTWQLILHEK